ncbi:MAG: hypothetical protein ABIR70_20025 [Bryobacteraceae bacterium]
MSEFVLVWYQPLLGAIHVLGVAAFGATLLADAPLLRRVGLVWMLATGALLFAANAERIYTSTSFRIKIAILVTLFFVKQPRWLVLGLWAAVIFASRGIAYF